MNNNNIDNSDSLIFLMILNKYLYTMNNVNNYKHYTRFKHAKNMRTFKNNKRQIMQHKRHSYNYQRRPKIR